tara:strand:- start:132 stop:536 length:405 start_codon:yes stop_codon:yes gene_type:complete
MKTTWLTRIMSSVNSPLKHVVDAKGNPKGKGHIKKHEENHWGPEGHGDRSFTGIVAKGVNTVQEGIEGGKNIIKEGIEGGKDIINEIGEKIEKGKEEKEEVKTVAKKTKNKKPLPKKPKAEPPRRDPIMDMYKQ